MKTLNSRHARIDSEPDLRLIQSPKPLLPRAVPSKLCNKRPAENSSQINHLTSSQFNHDIRSIVNATYAGQHANILDYTSGHLNDSHVNSIQKHSLSRKSWNFSEKPKPSVVLPKISQGNSSKMKSALAEFTGITSGATAMLPSESNSANQEEVCECESDDVSLYTRGVRKAPNVLIEEIALEKVKVVDSARTDSPPRHKFVKATDDGITRADQFHSFLGWQHNILKLDELKNIKVMSRDRIAQDLNSSLKKRLQNISRKGKSSVARTKAHGRIWEKLIEQCPSLENTLREIKCNYDEYYNFLLEQNRLDRGSLDAEVSLLITSSPLQTKNIEEETKLVSELEAEAELLLHDNEVLYNKLQEVCEETGDALNLVNDFPEEETDISEELTYAEQLENKHSEIVAMQMEIEAIRIDLSKNYVPTKMMNSAEQLLKNAGLECAKYMKMSEVIADACINISERLNNILTKAEVPSIEAKILWKKIRTLQELTSYCTNPSKEALAAMEITDDDVLAEVKNFVQDLEPRESFDFYK